MHLGVAAGQAAGQGAVCNLGLMGQVGGGPGWVGAELGLSGSAPPPPPSQNVHPEVLTRTEPLCHPPPPPLLLSPENATRDVGGETQNVGDKAAVNAATPFACCFPRRPLLDQQQQQWQ